MSRLRVFLTLMATAALAIPGSAGADADEPDEPDEPDRVLEASFEGRTINLAVSWEGATICAAVSQDDIRCARDEDTLRRDVTRASRSSGSGEFQAAATCKGQGWRWIRLYEHSYYQGRTFLMNDTNFWYNLGWAGFNDIVSSWWNDTGCHSWMSEHSYGAGDLYYMPPYSYQGWVGSFNDKASAIYIAA